jgi:hypothetical protein
VRKIIAQIRTRKKAGKAHPNPCIGGSKLLLINKNKYG